MNTQTHCPLLNLINPTHAVTMHMDTYAAKYVPPGYRTPSPDEFSTRRTAQDLKIPTAAAIQIAAPAMAALIDGPCWLVPVPASSGSLAANLVLAHAIAEIVPGARVKCAIGRAHPVQSSRRRRLCGLPRLTIGQHAIIRITGPMQPLPVYFVDNVITTGTTLAACRRALGWGSGLAYADASKPRKDVGKPASLWPRNSSTPADALHDHQLVYAVRLPLLNTINLGLMHYDNYDDL